MTDIGLRILLQAQDQASGVIRSFMGLMGDMNGRLALLAGAGLLAVGAGLAYTANKAADFDQAMLANVAHAGLAKSQFDAVSKSVLAMAPAVGRAPIDLAEALYPILSAFSGITNQGAKAALSLDTLKNSFETVAGSATNGEAVAQSAVGTFNALGLATNNVSINTKRMTDLFDTMDLTVQLGNMHWEQYKNVVSKLAVAIQGTGISFNESQAALALMTNEGFSAQRASTYLINTFNTLAIKTNALAAHAKKLGIDFDQAKYGPMSFADKIEYLNKITDGNKQKLLALMGNNATALKTFNALSTGIGAYRSNLESLSHAHGALKYSFDTATQGVNAAKFHVQQIKAAFDVLAISIGQKVLLIINQLLVAIVPLIVRFTSWAMAMMNNKTALAIFAGVLAGLATIVIGVVVPAMWAWAAATIAATWPLLLAGAIVAAVVIGIIMAYQHWGEITKWVGGIFSWLGSHVRDILTGIKNFIGGIFDAIGSTIRDKLTGLKNDVGGFFSMLGGTAHSKVTDFKNMVGGAFSSLGSGVHGAITDIKNTVQGWGDWLYNHNTYIKRAVDAWPAAMKIAGTAIRTVLTDIKNFVGGIWSAIGTFIHDRLVWIQNTVGSIFSAIGTFIRDRLTWVKNFVGGIFDWIGSKIHIAVVFYQNLIGNAFSWIGSIMHSKTTEASNSVGNAFSSLGSKIQSILSGLWNWISGWFGRLAGQFFSWGSNLIGMLISGIKGAVGGLFSTIGGIAHNIAGMLGFHSPPPMGPLADADTYMPNMMKMFEHGIVAHMPAVQAALNRVAAPMAATGQGLSSSVHSSTSYSSGTNVINIGPVYVNAGGAANPSQLADQLIQEISRKLHQSGRLVTWSSGGRA